MSMAAVTNNDFLVIRKPIFGAETAYDSSTRIVHKSCFKKNVADVLEYLNYGSAKGF